MRKTSAIVLVCLSIIVSRGVHAEPPTVPFKIRIDDDPSDPFYGMPVRNQEEGNCYAQSATELVDAQINIQFNSSNGKRHMTPGLYTHLQYMKDYNWIEINAVCTDVLDTFHDWFAKIGMNYERNYFKSKAQGGYPSLAYDSLAKLSSFPLATDLSLDPSSPVLSDPYYLFYQLRKCVKSGKKQVANKYYETNSKNNIIFSGYATKFLILENPEKRNELFMKMKEFYDNHTENRKANPALDLQSLLINIHQKKDGFSDSGCKSSIEKLRKIKFRKSSLPLDLRGKNFDPDIESHVNYLIGYFWKTRPLISNNLSNVELQKNFAKIIKDMIDDFSTNVSYPGLSLKKARGYIESAVLGLMLDNTWYLTKIYNNLKKRLPTEISLHVNQFKKSNSEAGPKVSLHSMTVIGLDCPAGGVHSGHCKLLIRNSWGLKECGFYSPQHTECDERLGPTGTSATANFWLKLDSINYSDALMWGYTFLED